ncbi:hypothetical protein LshimejAT787_1103250 [Lyophyllum shimeji]|uniref:Uncharacterized protein n=1 Tax=Lyophyllum shimeji TaxID=47721 RepID=A0A9P3USC7_LYOSH|nr:hypothetical protein LshimejAT787_1103250 [Lyophyllum shimeji]
MGDELLHLLVLDRQAGKIVVTTAAGSDGAYYNLKFVLDLFCVFFPPLAAQEFNLHGSYSVFISTCSSDTFVTLKFQCIGVIADIVRLHDGGSHRNSRAATKSTVVQKNNHRRNEPT